MFGASMMSATVSLFLWKGCEHRKKNNECWIYEICESVDSALKMNSRQRNTKPDSLNDTSAHWLPRAPTVNIKPFKIKILIPHINIC